jgi:HK97 family phage prohead protease
MPYPNEHSARFKDPDDFDADSFRRKADGTIYGKIKVPATIDVIWGKLKGHSDPEDQPIPQALRFPTKDWTADEAKGWLEENKIKYIAFEPAKEEKARSMPPPGIKVPEGFQRRSFPLRELRVEPAADNQRKIVGYAAMFDVLSEPLWGFQEKIRKGAFTKTIGEADIRALFNHDENYVLGRKKVGTLKLLEDDTGLGIEILPPDTQWARDLMVTIKHGDVDQMSFSFRVLREEWSHTPSQEIRTLIEVELRDVSPVTFPAYTQTVAQVRSVFGVEVRTVGEALSRLETGSMTEADLQLLKRLLNDIHGRLAAAPGPAAHPAEGPQDQPSVLDHLRRQLELAERS